MRKAVAIFISLPLILCFAGLSFARMGGMHRAMEEMPFKQIAGVVEAVSLKEKTITVKGMSGSVTATCDDKTVLKMGNENKTLADVKVGDKVTMTFDVGEGKNLAKTILVSLPASASPEEKEPAPQKPEEKK